MIHLTEEQFLKDVANHKIDVKLNSDTHRHIVFSTNSSSVHKFELITWTNHLCIAGDMGTYVFRRLDDMFSFFRNSERDRERTGQKLIINPGYWSEKIESEDDHSPVKQFSKDVFRESVKRYYDSYYGDDRDEKVWKDIVERVLCIEDEYEAVEAIRNFISVNSSFDFTDFWEYGVKDYTYHFIWCLYAIVWGIDQFDKYEEELEKQK